MQPGRYPVVDTARGIVLSIGSFRKASPLVFKKRRRNRGR
jgi:hypothetical protein